MKNPRPLLTTAAAFLALTVLGSSGCGTTAPARGKAENLPKAGTQAVSYEGFGALGDGVADDLPAIVAAHAYANEHGLPVQSNPEATYNLGRRALTAIIQTDTDWGESRFIIDDSAGVEDHKRPLFEVRSRLQPVPMVIEHLTRGQKRLAEGPPVACLVQVENAGQKLFIRRGLNVHPGHPQQEVFILHEDGRIEGAIDWDYETVTRVVAKPIDKEPLVLRGGVFTNVANRMRQDTGYNYWNRNIEIHRSSTIVDGLVQRVTGESDIGHPYLGFLRAVQCANITIRNCRIDGRKTYKTIGRAGKPVSMGTYGYRADRVVNFRMINCRMDGIVDRSRWGVMTSNFIKNLLIEDCRLSRVDVHMGVSGHYTIRRSILGHQGIKAIGRGRMLIEDSAVYSDSLVDFRPDYGSNWEGEVIVRNSGWFPPDNLDHSPAVFRMINDGGHDFGYPCSMPERIQIDGLYIDDAAYAKDGRGITFFNDPLGGHRDHRPHPYRLTEHLEVRNLMTASGNQPRISDSPELVRGLTVDTGD